MSSNNIILSHQLCYLEYNINNNDNDWIIIQSIENDNKLIENGLYCFSIINIF